MKKIMKNQGTLLTQDGTHDEHRQIARDSVKESNTNVPDDPQTDSMAVHRGDRPTRLKRPSLHDPDSLAPSQGPQAGRK